MEDGLQGTTYLGNDDAFKVVTETAQAFIHIAGEVGSPGHRNAILSKQVHSSRSSYENHRH